MKYETEGLNSYSIGNYNFGIQLVLRNLGSKEAFCRRYIRLIFSLFGTRSIFEFRFANSI